MKYLSFLFVAILACTTLSAKKISSSASCSSFFNSTDNERPDRNRKVGDFRLIGKGRGKSVVLSNNIFYEPRNKNGRKKTKHWKIGDVCRVLRTLHTDKFVLINLRNGNSIRTRVICLD